VSRRHTPDSQRSQRILIVEDEIFVAWHLESILKDLDFTVSGIVPDGRAAMAQTQELGVTLVLMDINLKGDLDGIETARRIRETSDAVVVFVTAYSDPATLDRIEAAVPGAPVLAKPVSSGRLRMAISKALEPRSE
jgi:CheY-like chemotaxis protein